MQAEPLDIAGIFRLVSPDRLSADQRRVYQAIVRCRTSALGGHVTLCQECGRREQSYNSCWNRHCPKCQGGAAFSWASNRMQELLPAPYYHVVFTLPSELRELCYYNKRLMYEILYASSSRTLLDVARNNEGIQLGFLSVLHSWNQELGYHPHIHHIVPGGGLTPEGSWRKLSRGEKFLLPVRVLSKVFCGKFIEALKAAYADDTLYLERRLSHLKNPRAFEHLMSKVASRPWVVYAKRPFAGPDVVLKYLAHYTHRVAISNRRLRDVDATTVSFAARDRHRKHKKRIVTLSHSAFVRRFLQHTLPKGFRRIRYFGFLANSDKRERLSRIRQQLGASSNNALIPSQEPPKLEPTCANCGCKSLVILHVYYNPHRGSRGTTTPRLKKPTVACLSPPLAA